MNNKSVYVAGFACLLLGGTIVISSCSAKTDLNPPASASPSNVKLTPAQRQNIRLYTVAPSKYHKSIATTGVVDFDNDQATSVLAAFSGPVSRLVVSLGQHVKQGDPLAMVDSPDFAAAISAYQKALATAQTLRRLADLDGIGRMILPDVNVLVHAAWVLSGKDTSQLWQENVIGSRRLIEATGYSTI